MTNISKIKEQQSLEMQEYCIKQGIEYKSMERFLDAERKKKLQKRIHYIQQTIDSEIENVIKS